jgi:septum formation protein
MNNAVQVPKIILASTSPRRKYLLEQAGLKFSIIPSRFEETAATPEAPETYVRLMAEGKAGEVAGRYPGHWVIGADTVVLIDNVVLGKPQSRDQAQAMLTRLSGRTHRVLTAFCICCQTKKRWYCETVGTDVCFKKLSALEIEWYIASGEPLDKAGAYGIQGLGMFLVKRINGSYTNVVGLPVCEVLEVLTKEGVPVLAA